MIKLLPNFKGLAHPIIGNGRSISFWDDQWSQNIPRQKFPELFSFVKNTNLFVKEAKELYQFASFFHLPISEQAYDQYLELQVVWEQIALSNVYGRWRYIWGSDSYSSQKAYRHFMGQMQVHPIYKHLWKSKCQPKHRVFYRLWLKNKLNTRDVLRRKNMTLESYSCENCLWQREETLSFVPQMQFRKRLLELNWNNPQEFLIQRRPQQTLNTTLMSLSLWRLLFS
jgi:hypothetical protein